MVSTTKPAKEISEGPAPLEGLSITALPRGGFVVENPYGSNIAAFSTPQDLILYLSDVTSGDGFHVNA